MLHIGIKQIRTYFERELIAARQVNSQLPPLPAGHYYNFHYDGQPKSGQVVLPLRDTTSSI